MEALGYVYTLGKQTSRFPKCCTSRHVTSAEFLEVQVPPHILVYHLDPLVSCVNHYKCKNVVEVKNMKR